MLNEKNQTELWAYAFTSAEKAGYKSSFFSRSFQPQSLAETPQHWEGKLERASAPQTETQLTHYVHTGIFAIASSSYHTSGKVCSQTQPSYVRDPPSAHITSRHINPLWPGILVVQMEPSFLETKAWCEGAQSQSDPCGMVKTSPTLPNIRGGQRIIQQRKGNTGEGKSAVHFRCPSATQSAQRSQKERKRSLCTKAFLNPICRYHL